MTLDGAKTAASVKEELQTETIHLRKDDTHMPQTVGDPLERGSKGTGTTAVFLLVFATFLKN